MTFPTTPILDDFNRADEGPPPSADWIGSGTGLLVSSNKCVPEISGGVLYAGNDNWNHLFTFATVVECYAQIATLPTSGYSGLEHIRLLMLYNNSSAGYTLQWYASDTDAFLINPTSVGSDENDVTRTLSSPLSNGDWIGFAYNGSALQAYVKYGSGAWETVGAPVATTIQYASGYNNLGIFGNGVVDNFGGGAPIPPTDDSGGQPGDDDPGGSAPGPVPVGPAYLINCHHIDASGAGAIGLRVADVAYVMNSRVTGDVGVQVETGGILRLFGLQYPSKNLVGTGAIKPLFGDRAAWDTTTYAGRHAHDISEGTYLYHTNPTNPPITQLAPITTVSAPTALDATHYIVIVSNGSTITLPTAASIAGKQYNIIRSGTSNVLINTTGGQTISGDASLTLTAQWDSVVVVSNGSNWIRCS